MFMMNIFKIIWQRKRDPKLWKILLIEFVHLALLIAIILLIIYII